MRLQKSTLATFSRRRFIQSSLSLALLSACSRTAIEDNDMLSMETIGVSAPFTMPTISVADFSAMPVFNILNYGAQFANLTANNLALASAIQAASEQGGGSVFIPPGEWLCGTIHLKSKINLHLAEGAVLLFSENPEDYLPVVKTTWEGMECYNYSPLIYAFECSHVSISGKGKLKAKMDVWTPWGKRPKAHMDALASLYHQASQNVPVEQRQMAYEGANLRPHFVQFNRCQHVLIEDISIENSPFWVLHPFLCKDVVIRRVNVKAHGHNNDGVDPEMTQNMLIEDCIFDQGDDAIAIKSGRNQDAWRLNTPTKNLVMRNCRIKRAHQLVAIGSELSAGVENVFVHHCQFDSGTEYEGAGNLLFIKTNERRGGLVKNIVMQDITAGHIAGSVLSIETDVLYQWRTLVPTYERRLTQIEQIQIQNINAKQAKHLCKIQGQEELPVRQVRLRNINVAMITDKPVDNQFIEDFSLT